MSLESPQPTSLIAPRELPVWVPGKVLSDSASLGWKNIAQRSYRYQGQDVEIPPMDSFMIVNYRVGETQMDRQVDGRWTRTRCRPGNFSLLSRSADSHWNWTSMVEVSHLYLSNDLLCKVASELQEQDVGQVDLHDVLEGSDPVVTQIADAVTREAEAAKLGGALYVEALSLQLAVHLLRDYATCSLRKQRLPGGLSARNLARLEDYVDAHLHDALTIEEMAAALGMGVWTFLRQLRRSLGCSAYAYVVERRVARARRLLQQGDLALKEIAAACGFADQPHLTRTFRAKMGVTPGRFRNGLQ